MPCTSQGAFAEIANFSYPVVAQYFNRVKGGPVVNTNLQAIVESDAEPVVAVLPLPGEGDEDNELIESTVSAINAIWRQGGVETARKVGELIVQRFFDGSVDYAHSRKRGHLSYQALTEHPNLAVAASNLWYCVAVFEHFGVLPVAVAGALTVGHHRLLAHVGDADQKARLAAQAVQSALTVDELKVAIAAGKVVQPGAKKRGRPPLPAVVKATEPVSKAMTMMKQWNADKVAALAADERAYALDLAREAARELAAWVALLEAAGPSVE